jgi:hypothetical protein
MAHDEDFKINDHFVPAYTRMFMRQFPQHDAFFSIRGSVFDDIDLPEN